MLNSPSHSLRRSIVATILTAIYLMIALSPLASLAMHSKTVAHALTNQCSGDCNICGCSPESMASKTCCCSKKREQEAHAHDVDDQDGTPDCCKKKPVGTKAVIASCGCPCGNTKPMTLSGGIAYEILPYYFTEQFQPSHSATHYSDRSHLLTSRHAEPPDPPPRRA